jgi:hypothetical protein
MMDEAIEWNDHAIIMPGAFRPKSDVPVTLGGIGGPVIGKADVREDGTALITFFDDIPRHWLDREAR